MRDRTGNPVVNSAGDEINVSMETVFTMDTVTLAKIFTEWKRRANDTPERFQSEFPDAGSYGEKAAKYFLQLTTEVE